MVRWSQLRSAMGAPPFLTSSTLVKVPKVVPTRISHRRRGWRRGFPVIFFILPLLAGLELHTSWIQAHVLSIITGRMTFHLASEPGDPPAIRGGPYDARLGYASLRTAVDGLTKAGFRVVAHTEFSSLAIGSMKIGLPPIYREKTQAGLLLEDDQEHPLYQTETPQHVYQGYSSIPELIVQSLLLAENREMLDASTPNRNPTIEWSRLARAVFDFGLNQIYYGHPVTGGSTIATQLEKLRHSPGGRTISASEKFRQMLAASLRAYPSGPKNLAARKQIVCDYINSLPLAAMTGHGEIIGLADGLQAWFGVSADQVNPLLNLSDQEAESTGQLPQKALAYRQALTLLLAAKKPSTYLVKDANALARRVDSYLPLLQSRRA